MAADVLDAWFGLPEPLLAGLAEELPFLLRVSPPTHSEGLETVIAEHRGLPAGSVLAADGSSRLIHLLLRRLVGPGDSMLVLEPTYSEYRHVGELVGARVEACRLFSEDGFAWSAEEWLKHLQVNRPAVAVLVRPNNPTGTRIDPAGLLEAVPESTTLLVDEAYIDYTDLESMEGAVAGCERLVVIKSLSKAYGLSGARLAYAVLPDRLREDLSSEIPPWSVSGVAQWLGCRIWDHSDWFQARRLETTEIRRGLVRALERFSGRVLADCANWVLWELPSPWVNAEVVPKLAELGVYVRDAAATAPSLSSGTIRIAVRPPEEQARLLRTLDGVLGCPAKS
ncbi:MAG: aminotransferase class I/II-fold pyridoxal phosphate-dependent enzyme [Fimbriimonadaceae bacterium]|nr:aminotransferase class I/II-fold pyridoxal phosphate-dependent enzyme [Fimbriimonadaceae bacterium]